MISSKMLGKFNKQALFWYGVIFVSALMLRLFFAFYFQQFMWGEFRFVMPDTGTYLGAFMNLINHGAYCFDLNLQDSCFYRLPTYPFFLGANYLFFGDYAWVSVSIFQAILSSLTCVLAVILTKRLTSLPITPWIVAVIFVCNPFTISRVPLQMPETVGIFLVLLSIYFVVTSQNKFIFILGGAATLVFAVWTKQYVLAIFPAVVFYMAARKELHNYPKNIILFTIAFAVCYSPWVIRNYINYGQFAVLVGKTSGVSQYQSDYVAAMRFVALFYLNNTDYLHSISREGHVVLPHSDFTAKHKEKIDKAVQKAYKCGPSFKRWRDKFHKEAGNSHLISTKTADCEKEVAKLFYELNELAKKEMSFWEYYQTGFEGFRKSIIKTDFYAKSGSIIIQEIFFTIRGILLLIAFFGVFFIKERRMLMFALGAISSWVFTSGVIAFEYRHVNMYYLMMVDVPLIIVSSYVLALLLNRFRRRASTTEKDLHG